jgi:hypothetical protein
MKWKAILQDGFFIDPAADGNPLIPRQRGKEVRVNKNLEMPDQRWSGI